MITTALEIVSFAGVCDQGHIPDLLESCPKHFVCDFNGMCDTCVIHILPSMKEGLKTGEKEMSGSHRSVFCL